MVQRVQCRRQVWVAGLRGGVVGIDLHAACNSTLLSIPSLSLHPPLCTISPTPRFSLLSPTLFFLLDSFPSGFCVK